MKTLYITFDGLTDPLGQSQILPYLSRLSKAGHSLCIISLEKSDRFQEIGARTRDQVNEHGLTWSPLTFQTRPPLLGPLWNLITVWLTAIKLHKRKAFQAVHCRSYMASLVGLWLKKNYGLKFLFDMRGFWADERIEGEIWSLSSPIHGALYRFFKRKERDFFASADAVVSLTQVAVDEVLRQNPELARQKFVVVPCCADLGKFCGRSLEHRETVRNALQISKDSTVVVYLGSLGTWYCLEQIVEFFTVFRTRRPDSTLLILTNSPAEQILEVAKRLELPGENLRILSSPSAEVPRYLSAADAGVNFIKPCFSKKASSPTKLGEMLAMGLPVVSNTGIGDIDILSERYSMGPILGAFTEQSYRAAVRDLEPFLALPPEHYRDIACHYFDLQSGVQTYQSAYERLEANSTEMGFFECAES